MLRRHVTVEVLQFRVAAQEDIVTVLPGRGLFRFFRRFSDERIPATVYRFYIFFLLSSIAEGSPQFEDV